MSVRAQQTIVAIALLLIAVTHYATPAYCQEIDYDKLVHSRTQAFRNDPAAMVMYKEADIILVIYRTGKVEFTGKPRLKTLPERVDSYSHEIPMERVTELEREFVRRRYVHLEYRELRGRTGSSGAALEFKNHSGQSKALGTSGPNRPPREFYELVRTVLLFSEISRYTCSFTFSQHAVCDDRYRPSSRID